MRQSIQLNGHFVSLIESSQHFELVTPPSFAMSVFRMQPIAELPLFSQDDLTRKLYNRVSARKDILLTQTVLQGVFCIRFAVGAVRTGKKHIDGAYSLLCEEANHLLTDLKASHNSEQRGHNPRN